MMQHPASLALFSGQLQSVARGALAHAAPPGKPGEVLQRPVVRRAPLGPDAQRESAQDN